MIRLTPAKLRVSFSPSRPSSPCPTSSKWRVVDESGRSTTGMACNKILGRAFARVRTLMRTVSNVIREWLMRTIGNALQGLEVMTFRPTNRCVWLHTRNRGNLSLCFYAIDSVNDIYLVPRANGYKLTTISSYNGLGRIPLFKSKRKTCILSTIVFKLEEFRPLSL